MGPVFAVDPGEAARVTVTECLASCTGPLPASPGGVLPAWPLLSQVAISARWGQQCENFLEASRVTGLGPREIRDANWLGKWERWLPGETLPSLR